MSIAESVRGVFKTLTDSRRRKETIDRLLPLLKTMDTPENVSPFGLGGALGGGAARPGLAFEGDVTAPGKAGDDARFMAQCFTQLVQQHPEYALLVFTKNLMIVRRSDLARYASKETREKCEKDGVIVLRDNLPPLQ